MEKQPLIRCHEFKDQIDTSCGALYDLKHIKENIQRVGENK